MADLPLYAQINIWMILGSAGIIFVACCFPFQHKTYIDVGNETYELPRFCRILPLNPPGTYDRVITLLYVAFTALIYATSCLEADTPPSPEENMEPGGSIIIAIINMLMAIVLYMPLIIRYLTVCYPLKRLKLQYCGDTLLCLVGIYMSIIVFLNLTGLQDWIIEATDTPVTQKAVQSLQEASAQDFIMLTINAVIIAPFVEEIVFRGFFFRILSCNLGVCLAAIISSLLFGAIHVSLAQTASLTIFGLFQCFLYKKTQSIIYPMLLHMAFNSISVITIVI